MRIRKRKKRGGLVLDYRDSHGKRHEPSFKTHADLEAFVSTELPKVRGLNPTVDAAIIVRDYFIRWLQQMKSVVEAGTLAGYESIVRVHILPRHGDREMRGLRKADILAHLTEAMATHSKNTVRRMQQVYHAAFDWAVEEEIVAINPAARLGKRLKLVTNRKAIGRKIKAMDRPQLQAFLARTLEKAPDLYPLFLFMARNGFRPGEAYAAQRANLTLHPTKDEGSYYVEHALSAFDGEIGDPKTEGSIGTVYLTPQTVRMLRAHLAQLPVGSALLFPAPRHPNEPHQHRVVARRMHAILKAAGLPLHFTPHCLRHTYASQALAAGESLLFVQQQLRHATLALTADLYGKWLPKKSTIAPGLLDDDFAAECGNGQQPLAQTA